MTSTTAIKALGAALAIALLASPTRADLVAYYTFDDGTATDLSGNGNHGIESSGVTYSTDVPLAPGLSFETPQTGADYDIVVPTSASLEGISDELTLSFWMKADVEGQNNWVRIFQHANEGNGTQGWLVDRYSGSGETNIRVDTTGAGGQFNQNLAEGVGGDTFDREWHHIAYILDEGTWTEYVDGMASSGPYNHGDGFSNTRPLYIGGRNGNAEYVGLLDEIAVWDTALEHDQVILLSDGAPANNIPEPATLALLGLGALALIRRRRRP